MARNSYVGYELKREADMHKINTAKEGWQKDLADAMKRDKDITITTNDAKFANHLEKNNILGVIKYVIIGSDINKIGLIAVTGIAGFAAYLAKDRKVRNTFWGLFKTEEGGIDENTQKVLITAIAGVAAVLGFKYLNDLSGALLSKKYEFKFSGNVKDGVFELYGKPRNGMTPDISNDHDEFVINNASNSNYPTNESEDINT
jgi:hypothetical protein